MLLFLIGIIHLRFICKSTECSGSDGFAVCDISLGVSKEIKITDSFSVPAFAKVTVNPRTEGAYFVFGLSF